MAAQCTGRLRPDVLQLVDVLRRDVLEVAVARQLVVASRRRPPVGVLGPLVDLFGRRLGDRQIWHSYGRGEQQAGQQENRTTYHVGFLSSSADCQFLAAAHFRDADVGSLASGVPNCPHARVFNRETAVDRSRGASPHCVKEPVAWGWADAPLEEALFAQSQPRTIGRRTVGNGWQSN